MSERVRIIRVLENPRKKRARKKMTKRKRVRRRKSVRRRPGGGFLIQGSKGGKIFYIRRGVGFTHLRKTAARFASAEIATREMRRHRAAAEKKGFSWLQVVVA